MKILNKSLLLLVLLVLTVTMTSCKGGRIKLSLEEEVIEIKVGEEYRVSPVVTKVTNPALSFSLSDTEVISIRNRVIKGLKPGECVVTISLRDYPKVKSVELLVRVVE